MPGIRIILLFLAGFNMIYVPAQNLEIDGIVKNEQGELIVGAHVIEIKSNKYTISDDKGNFKLTDIPRGDVILNVSYIGYDKLEKKISLEKSQYVTIILSKSSLQIDEAIVVGESREAKILKSGYAVSTISPDLLAGSSLNTNTLFKSTSGVNIRQTGGYGSSINVSINGLTGKMVRFFEDGIPLDNGYLSPIYFIPFNKIERLEVYKGVVPEHLAYDALGGAINFVSLPIKKEYFDVSIETGSYGLFKTFIGKRFITDSGWVLGGDFSYASSKNNYPVDAEISDPQTGRVKEETVNRFHDEFESYSGKIELGVLNKNFADEFYTTLHYNYFFKELQHGLLMQNPAGEAEVTSNIWRNRVVWKKDTIFNLPLNLELTNVISNNKVNYTDTTRNVYNWYGQVAGQRVLGNEIYNFDSPHDARVNSLNNYLKLHGKYSFDNNSSLNLTGIYSYYKREGTDPPARNEEGIDPYSAIPVMNKGTFTLSYSSDFFSNKITSITGLKLHWLRASQSESLLSDDEISATGNYLGGWQVFRYSPLKQLSLNLSYEYAYRLPDENELFGDVVLISPNTNLRPEKSHNINFGILWHYHVNSYVKVNSFYRDISDIIFLGFPINGARYSNVFSTGSYGGEIEGIARLKNSILINYSLTYQELRNMSNFNYDGTASTRYYNTRLPNIPWLYGNAGIQIKRNNLIGKNSESSVSLQTFYVHEYFLQPEPDGGGSSKYIIPTQFYQNVGIKHRLIKMNLEFGIELQNIFDQKLYDNFRVQKPGRLIQFLVRYNLN